MSSFQLRIPNTCYKAKTKPWNSIPQGNRGRAAANIVVGRIIKTTPDTVTFHTSQQVSRENQNHQRSWKKTDKTSSNSKLGALHLLGRDGHVRDGCLSLSATRTGGWENERRRRWSRRQPLLKLKKILGLTDQQYEMFLKVFGKNNDDRTNNTPKETWQVNLTMKVIG